MANAFEGKDDVIGKSIVFSGHQAEIIGIAPLRFNGAQFAESTDAWLPMLAYARTFAGEATLADRKAHQATVLGQLVKERSLEEAATELEVISRRLQGSYPDASKNEVIRPIEYRMLSSGSLLGQNA